LSYNRWWFDEIYAFLILNPLMAFARFMWTFDARIIDGMVNGAAWLTMVWVAAKQWFDTWIIDGAVNGSGWLVRQLGDALRFIQSGGVQFYALFVLAIITGIAIVKFEILAIDVSWPILTTLFVAGVVLIGVWSRLAADKDKAADALEGEN
jgi:hypothetical protein